MYLLVYATVITNKIRILTSINTIILTVGRHSEDQQRAAYLYGTYVGQAFQLVDDVLDFEGIYELNAIFYPSLNLHSCQINHGV